MPDTSGNLIYENVPFERRWMWFERAMWALLLLILLASCFGVLGRGAYARRTERSGPLTLQYDRIVRSRTQTDMMVSFDSSASSNGEVRLLVTGALLDNTRLYDVIPKPSKEETVDQGMVLTFKTVPGRPGRVTLIQKVEGIGRVQSHVVLNDSSSVTLDQIILP